MPLKILVPLDGSRLSELALPYAEALARPARGRMILIRAAESARFPVLEPLMQRRSVSSTLISTCTMSPTS